jgi:hypothetical protein
MKKANQRYCQTFLIFESIGTTISEGTISNIMIEDKREEFAAEKNAIFKTGMENADYFQIDARHAGKNHYLDVVCNDQFGPFFILGGKSKDDLRPIFGLKEGEQIDKPMVSDAAQQFHSISSKQGLCWIHEIRHYRKLTPVLEQHRTLLSGFIDRLWHYYELLADFKENPDCGFGVYLEWLFDFIFSPTAKTGYVMLDETIAAGFSEWYLDLMPELAAAQEKGFMSIISHDVEKVTGKKPITFAQFAIDYANGF